MINWAASVIEPNGMADRRWGALIVQPDDADMHKQLAVRLRRARCAFLSAREYAGVVWPETTCTVTVQPVADVVCVTELHTGASRLLPTEPLELPPLFVESLARRRVLLALLPPGTLPVNGEGLPMPAEGREHVAVLVEQAAGRRELLAGYARVLDQPAPRPAPRTSGAPRGRR